MRPFVILLVLVFGHAVHGQSSMFIEASAPGYGARDAELNVLAPLEAQLNGIEGVLRMRGLALDGKCLVQLDLTAETDPQLVGMVVQNRVALARTGLPPLCTAEILPPTDGSLMLVSLDGGQDMPVAEVKQWVKKTAWPLLANVPGLAHIRVLGAVEQRVRIAVDPERLRAYNLAVRDVTAAMQGATQQFDTALFDGKKLTLQKRAELDDLKNFPIRLEPKSIYLRDIASVTMEEPQHAGISRREGKDLIMRRAVLVLVQLAPGKLNALAKNGLEKAIKEIRTKLPAGMLCDTQLLQADVTTVVMRIGSAPWMSKTKAAAKAMMEIPEVRTLSWIAQPDDGEVIFYVLADGIKRADLHKSLRAKLAGIEETNSRVGGQYSPLLPWPGQGAQFVVRLQGKDLEKLQKTAEMLRERLAKTPGIVDIDPFPKMRQEAAVTIDQERMGLAGVRTADIVAAMNLREQSILGWPWHITLAVPVPIVDKAHKQSAEELGLLDVGALPQGARVLLRDVAKVRMVTVPSGVLHEGGRPCAIVFGNIEGRTLEEADADIRRISQELAGKDFNAVVQWSGKK